MEIRNLCCSSTSTPSKTIIKLGRPVSSQLDRPLMRVPTTARSRWRSLWRRLMREKRRMRIIFDCSAAAAAQVHVPGYDPYTYAQNFDRGLMWDDEPDSLSRSFSMRFAAPNNNNISSNKFVISGGGNNNNGVINRSFSDVGDNHLLRYHHHHHHQDVACAVF